MLSLSEVKIRANTVRIGMFVSRLDRPWLETPFPLQGFQVRSPKQVEKLIDCCLHVYVDVNRGEAPDPRFVVHDDLQQPDPRAVAEIERLRETEYEDQTEMREEIGVANETYDLLITPTAIVLPFDNEHLMPPEWDTSRSWLWELPLFCFNFTRQPAITVPCGFSESGLPVGLQIVAPIYEDSRALWAAHAFQTAYSTTDRRPPLD